MILRINFPLKTYFIEIDKGVEIKANYIGSHLPASVSIQTKYDCYDIFLSCSDKDADTDKGIKLTYAKSLKVFLGGIIEKIIKQKIELYTLDMSNFKDMYNISHEYYEY